MENKSVEIARVMSEFYGNKNLKLATGILIKKICDIFSINRSTIFTKKENSVYTKIFECNSMGKFLDKSDNFSEMGIDVSAHVAIGIAKRDAEDDFRKVFEEDFYFYTENFNTIKATMYSANYDSPCSSRVSSFYSFYVTHKWFLTYFTFELYDEKVISGDDLEILTSMCQAIKFRVEEFEAKKQLENELKLKGLILENESMPIAVVEKGTYRVLYNNDDYKKILPDICVDKVCYTLYGKDSPCNNCCIYSSQLLQNIQRDGTHWIKKSVPVELSDNVEAYVIYAKNTKDYIEQLDGIDILTSALSLKGFEEYYNETAVYSENNYMIVTLDIDKFKYINNILGYEFGNKILRRISNTIKGFMEKEEFFCRINEDKFALLLAYDDEESVRTRVESLKELFQNMQETYFSGKKITVIGGACFVDKSLELNTLIDMANTARKSAKGSYSNKMSYYDDNLEQLVISERIIEQRMFSAMENNEFVPYLQPKFDINTRELYGAEALVRWIAKDGTIMYPDEFIPIFEKNGFITTLDFVMYEKVMAYIRSCINRNIDVCPISLNVSRGHINDNEFISKFTSLLDCYEIPINLIELEVTESVFVEDQSQLKKFIEAIRREKIKISIDDFGTAYSSLHVLKDVEVDVLKIDKGFLHNINAIKVTEIPSKDEVVIKHIISMAKELNFQVICEGIETEEQISILKSIGCEFGQGYLFSKPLPISEFEEMFFKDGERISNIV